jgi:hypothetical protein
MADLNVQWLRRVAKNKIYAILPKGEALLLLIGYATTSPPEVIHQEFMEMSRFLRRGEYLTIDGVTEYISFTVTTNPTSTTSDIDPDDILYSARFYLATGPDGEPKVSMEREDRTVRLL